MSITAQNIIDVSLARARDPHETQWTDAQLLAHLNKGVHYLHSKLIGHQVDWATTKIGIAIPTVDGTELYNLPSDFWSMHPGNGINETGVWLNKTTSYSFLAPVDQRESVLGIGSDEAEPTRYYLTETQIGLLPVPDAVYTLMLRYYFSPITMTLTTVMPYGNIFNEALSSFMSSRALADAGLIAAGEMSIYNELETTALTIAQRRTPKSVGFKLRRS